MEKAKEFIGYKGINNQGERFIVIDYKIFNDGTRFRTKFLLNFYDTGYKGYYSKQCILKGMCKDPYYPSILGVACIGLAASRDMTHTKSKPSREYNMWKHMIYRVYDPNNDMYYTYGAIGVSICKRWHCFEYFLQDLPALDNYQLWKDNPGLYQLDKDLKQQHIPLGQRVYSPQTCMFVTNQQNIIESKQRLPKGKLNLPQGIYLNSAGNYEVSYSRNFLGIFTNLDAAISQRNDYIMNTASIPNTAIQPCNYIPREERKQYRSNRPCHTMCRIMGDDRSDEFLAKIEEQMNKNDNE